MKKVFIIILMLIFICLIVYFVIRNNSNIASTNNQDNFTSIDLDNLEETESNTFYAKIKEIYNTSILVEGLEKNDRNHRGEFSFGVHEDTDLRRKNEKISFSDLSVGQTIYITYTGGVKESYPAQINNIIKIEVLN